MAPLERARSCISTPVSRPQRSYSHVINTAEKSVDRLSRAIDAAEDEMECALRRTGDVQRTQFARKDIEMTELRRVIAAKEKSIDSLRETLATTKRSLESRLQKSEGSLSLRDAELQQMQNEYASMKSERDSLRVQIQQLQSCNAQEKEEQKSRVNDLDSALAAAQQDHSQVVSVAKKEKKEREKLQRLVEELKDQLKLAMQKAKLEAGRRKDNEQQLDAERQQIAGLELSKDEEIMRLKHQVKEERDNFKKAKKWLKAELKAREDMEALLVALRDIATGPQDSMIQQAGLGGNMPGADTETLEPNFDGGSELLEETKKDFKKQQLRLDEDGKKLRAELQATKRMLSQALEYRMKKGA
ncbi:hypothetical protein BSKO_01885 [Bryopsis sp. KO-2023]|nr:hypothetical protein BSKO_01885 [Bryopsis sp. KO-2023]